MSSRLTVADKRSFVHMAFYPHGAQVCRVLGLMPASDEVVSKEDRVSEFRLQTFMETEEFNQLAQLASWYHDGVEAATEQIAPDPRTDVEHMLSFFAAARTFLTPPEKT